MIRKRYRKKSGLGTMVAISAIVHLALYFFLVYYHFPAFPLKQEVTYYVDVVNLPVASPQAGSPASPPAAAPAPAKLPEMGQPAPPSSPGAKPLLSPAPQKATPAKPADQADSSKEFEERMKNMQRDMEERRQNKTIEDMRKRVAGHERAGVPGGAGTEAGSDYANYIQSRLKDALAVTISYQSRNPEIVVRLTIGRNGKVVNYVVEKSSHDRIFEQAVALAISRAEKTFPPPPGNREFVHGFIFKPEGVGKK